MGRNETAVGLISRAISINPFEARFFVTLARPLSDQGQFAAAIAAYRKAISMEPTLAEAHNNLGNALREGGQLDEAVAACRRAIQIKPDYPEAHHNLGAALAAQGHLEEAIAAYRHALELKPDIPQTYNNLGNALRERGQVDEAVTACRRALDLNPNFLEAHNSLGNALREQGQLDDAIAAFHRALALKPDLPEAYNNLSLALRERGRLDDAVAACRRAIELKPDSPGAHNNLGLALKELGQLDEAMAAYRCAIELKPDLSEAHNNLGNALRDQGELDEAMAAYRRALQIQPDYVGAHGNLVCTLHFHPGHDDGTISEEHRRWNRQFSDPLQPYVLPHANDRGLERRLRVGYVSPDFWDHAVGRYVLPLFEQHDRERFEIRCYSGVARPDWMTERLRALAGEWRNTVGVSDTRLAEIIREDAVDILVDLAMHTAGNRLPVFARRPAPVQVAWLAYPGSTGLHSIGYRLTDACMEPPGEKPPWSVEEPVRLADCWCCYDPIGESPEINALPALSAGGVTFGSLNNFAKVHEGVLALWARVLEAVKGSRLLMFCPEGRTRERVRAFFGLRGIATERLELAAFLPRREYLKLYQRIDIGLDPFPCNGMTTTCDALWMGAPVLTLQGRMPVSRAGLSLLSSVGLGNLAADSEDDYVRMAVELAGNLPRLADLRATLRARMQASPLMDAPRFARNVEAAYQSMWERWLRGQSSMREA
jgi:protein O-GlcNAc transferase